MARSKSEAREIFEKMGQDPSHWLGQAKRLKMSAEAVYDQFEDLMALPPVARNEETLAHMGSFMLLMGFSFENLIKGALVAESPKIVSDEDIKPGRGLDQSTASSWGNHDLLSLARKLVDVTEKEARLLERLKLFAIWGGRYPIPMRAENFVSSEVEGKRNMNPKYDVSVADALFQRIEQVLKDRQRESSP